jgi:hypothetical protein
MTGPALPRPVYAANNKLKPSYASFGGKRVHFPDGVYHLHYSQRDVC